MIQTLNCIKSTRSLWKTSAIWELELFATSPICLFYFFLLVRQLLSVKYSSPLLDIVLCSNGLFSVFYLPMKQNSEIYLTQIVVYLLWSNNTIYYSVMSIKYWSLCGLSFGERIAEERGILINVCWKNIMKQQSYIRKEKT